MDTTPTPREPENSPEERTVRWIHGRRRRRRSGGLETVVVVRKRVWWLQISSAKAVDAEKDFYISAPHNKSQLTNPCGHSWPLPK